MGSLAWVGSDGLSVAELVRPWRSAAAADAELSVAIPSDEAIAVGAFQRTGDAGETALPVFRRASGGAALRLGPGVVFVQLALSRVDALVPCAPDQLQNRYVRPLLAALTRATGKPARYFGRDWVAIEGRPVAAIGFGHHAGAGTAVVEAVVAATAPFAIGDRPSFRGKEPMTLGLDPSRVADAIAEAYRGLADRTTEASIAREAAEPLAPEPAWEATREEAIGLVAAGRDAHGVLRVGGELMASADAIACLEQAIADERADVGAAVDAALTAPGVVTFGVRSLASIRDVIVGARASRSGQMQVPP